MKMEARAKTRVRNMASKITTTDLAKELGHQRELMKEGFAQMDKRFTQMDKRLDQMDRRLDLMDAELKHQRELTKQGFEQVDKRFEQVDKRFEQVDKRFTMLTWFVGIITTVIMGFTLVIVKLFT
jgi:tetrahydromethanopterin S-methyltransferase subunit G